MTIVPASPEELAQCLAEANSKRQRIALMGNSTKARMGGPIAPYDVAISTAGLNKVLEYEPRDLTISVGAGISYCELIRVLAEHRQMIPLDPPFSDRATVGGIVAANTSGPRRRLYGSARDMVIGMTFATLEGKLIRTGGMVVKNVAGLDMGKLMIGSFGTLAAIATLNFRLLSQACRDTHVRSKFRHHRRRHIGARCSAQESAAAGRDRHCEVRRPLSTRHPGGRKFLRFWIATRASYPRCEWWKERMRKRCGGAFANPPRYFSGRGKMVPYCAFPRCSPMWAGYWSRSRSTPRPARDRVFVMATSTTLPSCGIRQQAPAWWSSRRRISARVQSYGRAPETILR